MTFDNGMYINMLEVAAKCCTFNLIIGARGIGKTYGTLKMTTINKNNTLFLRRLGVQIDNTMTDVSTPWSPVCKDLKMGGTCVEKVGKGIKSVWNFKDYDEKGKPIPINLLGLCTSVSTFASVRGVDFSTIDTIVLDEFIPEKRERPIKNEAEAFFNLYESVNRNRELDGKEPVKVFMLSNSNNFINPYLVGLNVVRDIEQLYLSDHEEYVDKNRSLYVYMPKHVPVSEKKRKTALYTLVGDGDFSNMAIYNQFNISDESVRRNVNIREYNAVFGVGEVYVYKHKSRLEYYICSTKHNKDYYYATEKELTRLNKKYGPLALMLLLVKNNVFYDSITSKSLFEYYFIQ